MNIFILKITDGADFDRVLHRSAHTTILGAEAYAEEILDELKDDIDSEWWYALTTNIAPLELHGAEE